MVQRLRFSLFILTLLVLSTPSLCAQYWLQQGSSASIEEALDIATDGSGNSYTTGYITSGTSIGGQTVSTNGSSDMFISKSNSAGAVQWIIHGGGVATDRGNAIACDATGNVFVTGFFNGSATFGTTTLTSSGAQDIFVAKYNSAGVFQWAVKAGGSGADIGNGIAVDQSGNVVVVGQFIGTATFGTTTLTSQSNSIDIFAFKLNSSGAFQWVKQGSGKLEDRALAVSCDGSGNSYITGQFSDTLTIDVTHNNVMQNAVFVLKLSSAGAETWFNVIGGGGFNIAYDIVADNSGNAYVTGDYQGTLTFFGAPPFAFTTTENFKIFVAKYSTSGALSWAKKAGSASEVSSRSIDIDNSGNVFVAGYFKCIFSEYSEEYGEAIFNSVGQEDIFMAKYSSSGTFSYARHLANRKKAVAYGVACDNNNRAVFCGVFEDELNIPTSNSFNATNLNQFADISCQPTLNHCGDSDYGQFHQMTSNGNLDMIIANCFDPNREPYDYFLRNSGGCNRDYPIPSIENGLDSITACLLTTGNLDYDSITCYEAGPEVTYSWSSINVSSTKKKHVMKCNFPDACIPDLFDTILVKQFPGGLPPKPAISDDVIINTNATSPDPIYLCAPATVELTASGFGSNSIEWFLENQSIGTSNPVTTSASGNFRVVVTDNNGCTRQTDVLVVIYDPIPPQGLKVLMIDSVTYCENSVAPINYMVYDSISNPGGNTACLGEMIPNTNIPAYGITSTPVITPTPANVSQNCQLMGLFVPDTTGWYVFSANLTYFNGCDTVVYPVSDSVYVTILPAPPLDSMHFNIIGPNTICPGDTVQLVGTGDTNFVWFGPGINGFTMDTVTIWASGNYIIGFTYSETNSFGCTTTNSELYQHTVSFATAPTISADTTLLCPGDTAMLVATTSGSLATTFNWQGPNGNNYPSTDTIYVNSSGLYYCSIGDSNCYFESNFIEVKMYTTPDINAAGNPVLCEGDSVVLSVSSINTSSITWLPPLSGSSLYQVVYQPGTYFCQVNSCGIVTLADITIIPSTSVVDIVQNGILCKDSFATLSVDSSFINYTWSHVGLNQPTVNVNDSGSYYIVVMDTDGCIVTDTAFVGLDQIFADINTVNDNALCFGDTMSISAVDGLDTYLWLPTQETTQSITVTQAGTYTLVAKDSNGCRSTSEPVTIFTPDTVAKVAIEGNLSFCEGDSVTLTTSIKGKQSFFWTPTSNDSNAIVVAASGTYSVNVIDTFGCLAKSAPITVFAQKYLLTTPFLQDTLICIGDVASFYSDVIGTVKWYDSTARELALIGNTFVTGPLYENHTYYVWSEDGYCNTDSIRIHVSVQDCDNIFVPNYLTPNGDGINDLFRAILPEHTCFKMSIYSRWGLLVHLSEGINIGWDGHLINTGEEVPEGTYYYIIEYCTHNEDNLIAAGSLTLLRD